MQIIPGMVYKVSCLSHADNPPVVALDLVGAKLPDGNLRVAYRIAKDPPFARLVVGQAVYEDENILEVQEGVFRWRFALLTLQNWLSMASHISGFEEIKNKFPSDADLQMFYREAFELDLM